MERTFAQSEVFSHVRSAGRASTSYCHRHAGPQAESTRWAFTGGCNSTAPHPRRSERQVLRAAAPEQAETSLESIATTEDALAQPEKIRKVPGRQTYRPASFQELVKDATTSVKTAMKDGLTRMEVEFPALPGNIDGEAEDRALRSGVVQSYERITCLNGRTLCRIQRGLRLVYRLQHSACTGSFQDGEHWGSGYLKSYF